MKNQKFRRIEKKYFLNKEQYNKLVEFMSSNFYLDKHGNSTICNLYFDTDDFELVRRSITKPIYKEKLRLRSYMVPNLESNVFLEIKKKYNKIVSKRRVKLTLKEFYKYINKEYTNDSQVLKEIDYMLERYKLKPKVFIAYDREAYYSNYDENFRITFDFNIRYRTEDVGLEYGDAGKLLLDENICIMEIKTLNSLPYYFSSYLSSLKIFPTSFSKYGNVYKSIKGEKIYV